MKINLKGVFMDVRIKKSKNIYIAVIGGEPFQLTCKPQLVGTRLYMQITIPDGKALKRLGVVRFLPGKPGQLPTELFPGVLHVEDGRAVMNVAIDLPHTQAHSLYSEGYECSELAGWVNELDSIGPAIDKEDAEHIDRLVSHLARAPAAAKKMCIERDFLAEHIGIMRRHHYQPLPVI